MKKEILFKTSIDIIYILQIFGCINIILPLWSGVININQVNVSVENWMVFHWSIFLLSAIAYFAFLVGLYFLRKVARSLLTSKQFSEKIIRNLKTTGRFFLYSSGTAILVEIILFIGNLSLGNLELVFDSNGMTPLLLLIIGLFFILQSKTLGIAKKFKEDTELTI